MFIEHTTGEPTPIIDVGVVQRLKEFRPSPALGNHYPLLECLLRHNKQLKDILTLWNARFHFFICFAASALTCHGFHAPPGSPVPRCSSVRRPTLEAAARDSAFGSPEPPLLQR